MQFSIDFLKYRYFALFLSIVFLASGFVAYFIKGGFQYNIDFTGGAELRISFEKPIEISEFRKAMNKQGWNDAIIQNVGTTGKQFLVRISLDSEDSQAIKEVERKFAKDVDEATPFSKMTVDGVEWSGADAGKDTQKNAFIAIFLSILILLAYITFRSKYSYAIGAIAALTHDLLSALVFILLFNIQTSTSVLAALLAILGYSLNDTIVIFARIRQNLKKMKGTSLYDVVNISLNQTMKRTLLTSFSTLLAVLSILILGGDVLRDFAFVMLVGVIMGTYSSIYVASPAAMAIIDWINKKTD